MIADSLLANEYLFVHAPTTQSTTYIVVYTPNMSKISKLSLHLIFISLLVCLALITRLNVGASSTDGYTNAYGCGSGHPFIDDYSCHQGIFCNLNHQYCVGHHVVKFVCEGKYDECQENESSFWYYYTTNDIPCNHTVQISVFSKNCRQNSSWTCEADDLIDYLVYYTGECELKHDHISACGQIVNDQGEGISNIQVKVCANETINKSNDSQNQCNQPEYLEIVTTDVNGYYSTSQFIPSDYYYTVIPISTDYEFNSTSRYYVYNWFVPADMPLGSKMYLSQQRTQHLADCAANQPNYGGDCRCNFQVVPHQETANISACGRVVDDNGHGVSDLYIQVCTNSQIDRSNFNTQNQCFQPESQEFVQTDEDGYFQTSDFIKKGHYYTVNPLISSIPNGYLAPFQTTSKYYVYDWYFWKDVSFNSRAYTSQQRTKHLADCAANQPNYGGDCRCQFVISIDRPPEPTMAPPPTPTMTPPPGGERPPQPTIVPPNPTPTKRPPRP